MKCGFSRAWFGAVGLCHGKLMLFGREQEGWGVGMCVEHMWKEHYSCKMHKISIPPHFPLHISAAEVEFAIVTHSWQDEAGLC